MRRGSPPRRSESGHHSWRKKSAAQMNHRRGPRVCRNVPPATPGPMGVRALPSLHAAGSGRTAKGAWAARFPLALPPNCGRSFPSRRPRPIVDAPAPRVGAFFSECWGISSTMNRRLKVRETKERRALTNALRGGRRVATLAAIRPAAAHVIIICRRPAPRSQWEG